jgi:hypothetical protein
MQYFFIYDITRIDKSVCANLFVDVAPVFFIEIEGRKKLILFIG